MDKKLIKNVLDSVADLKSIGEVNNPFIVDVSKKIKKALKTKKNG